jgi:hypothetical protein
MKKAERIKEQLIRTLKAEILKLESGMYRMSMKSIKIEEGSVNFIDPKTESDDDDFENAPYVTFEEFDIKIGIIENPNYHQTSEYIGSGKASISYDGNNFTATIDQFSFDKRY